MIIKFALKRLLQLIPLLVAISIVIFGIIQLPPGDYLTTYIQQLELAGNTVSQSTIINLTQQYALDKPVHIQYFRWITNIVTKGNFGRSFVYDRPVADILKERIGTTILISLLTLVFVWVVSIPIGIYSATHQYSFFDYVFIFIGFIGLAVPGFLIALGAIYFIFTQTGISLSGLFSPEFVDAPWSMAKFIDVLPRMGLAVFVIGITQTAGMIRQMRAMMLDELQKQYVITARAKGLEERKVLFKYPIRIAINPMISTIGWVLPGLISGEMIVSIVLNLPTMGPMVKRALMSQDMYLAASFLLIVSALTMVGTLVSDILLAAADPRIKFGGISE